MKLCRNTSPSIVWKDSIRPVTLSLSSPWIGFFPFPQMLSHIRVKNKPQSLPASAPSWKSSPHAGRNSSKRAFRRVEGDHPQKLYSPALKQLLQSAGPPPHVSSPNKIAFIVQGPASIGGSLTFLCWRKSLDPQVFCLVATVIIHTASLRAKSEASLREFNLTMYLGSFLNNVIGGVEFRLCIVHKFIHISTFITRR